MSSTASSVAPAGVSAPRRALGAAQRLFVRLGVLPFMLIGAIVVFGATSEQFLTVQNLTNLLRQSVYLILVSLGQMLVLVTVTGVRDGIGQDCHGRGEGDFGVHLDCLLNS